jgi:hypothetical protein
MSVSYVLNYIPKAELENLSLEYKVDYQVKKLDGQTMFQLLLFSMLNVKQNSLRVMEEFYHSLAFKSIANSSFEGVRYNSIRDRLVSINPDYFEAIFNSCLTQFQDKYLKKKHNIISRSRRYIYTKLAQICNLCPQSKADIYVKQCKKYSVKLCFLFL